MAAHASGICAAIYRLLRLAILVPRGNTLCWRGFGQTRLDEVGNKRRALLAGFFAGLIQMLAACGLEVNGALAQPTNAQRKLLERAVRA